MGTKCILNVFSNGIVASSLLHPQKFLHTRNVFKSNLVNCHCSTYSLISTGNLNVPYPLTPVNRNSQLFKICKRTLSTGSPAYQQHTTTKEDDKNEDKTETLARLQELQSRQKRMLEEPQGSDPVLIYDGLLTNQIKRLKFFSFTTSGLGLAMQPVMIKQASDFPVFANVAIFSMVGFFTVGTPFLIHLIAKKYVTEMVYDPEKDTYTLSVFNFLARKREISFKIDDVIVPEVPGPFTTFTVKTKEGKVLPFFVDLGSFINKAHYGRLMGYDKPIDLRLSVDNKTKKAS